MDIEGKHFPDEEDEYGPKKKKRVGKIVFRVLAVCSAIVYIICFARIFSSCDSKLLEDITFSDKAIEIYNNSPKDFVTYKINTKDFMEYYGKIVLSNVYYAETAGELEIGIKYNSKIVEDESADESSEEYPLVYKLYDQKGNEYKICNRINTHKGSYSYERVCFEGLKIDFTNNYLNTKKEYAEGEDVYFDTEESAGGEKYTLEIFNPVTGASNKFVIYDNNTSYTSYDFKPAK